MYTAGVITPVDFFQGRKVEVAIVGQQDSSVFFDKVGKVVTRPVEFDVRKVLGRIATDGFAPIFAAHLVISSQNEFADEAKRYGHGLGSDGAKLVGGFAEIAASVSHLVGVVND